MTKTWTVYWEHFWAGCVGGIVVLLLGSCDNNEVFPVEVQVPVPVTAYHDAMTQVLCDYEADADQVNIASLIGHDTRARARMEIDPGPLSCP